MASIEIKNTHTANPEKITPSKLKDKLLQPALTSHFQCWFFPTPSVTNWAKVRGFNFDDSENQEFISLSCSDASLPGSSLTTNEINDDFTGVTERHAYRRQYDDRADFTFYVDVGKNGGYNVIWFFENWMSYIVDEQRNSAGIDFDNIGRIRSVGDLGTIVQQQVQSLLDNKERGVNRTNFNYRIRFPETYQSTIFINKFEKDYRDRYLQYKFVQAYPISVNSMPISYESSQLLKCTVSFTYTRYIINKINNK